MDKQMFIEKMEQILRNILCAQWQDKQLWQHIQSGLLTATPAFEGKFYSEAKTKIMFVGRALNGWDRYLGNCATLEDTVQNIINQSDAFDTFVYEPGFGDGPRKYRHINSKFFRFIKQTLEYLGESDADTDSTWYTDTNQWNNKFVWANLYCVAPRNPAPGESGNPCDALIKLSVAEYVDLMQLYINYYQPDVVVFITDTNGWFIKWTRKKSFKDITANYTEHYDSNPIVATGNIGNSRIVVCKRPDRWGLSYDDVRKMARNVVTWIHSDN